jgi:hypothetical protein
MLARGMLTVHVAFERRIDADDVALLHGSKSDEVELMVILGAECVVLEGMIGPDDPVDPIPVGCAYPFSLEETSPPISIGYGGLDGEDDAEKLIDVASKDWVVKAVTLEYGA